MSHGRFKNPVEATLTGIKDLFRRQPLADHLSERDRLDGKTCLVTGASSGLGFAVAVDLARRGANLILACRSGIPEAGERVKQLSGSSQVDMIHVDLTDLDSVHAFCEELKTRGVELDVLVSNAGVAPPWARPTRHGLDEIFQVNYLAKFILANRLLSEGILPNATFAGNGRPAGRTPRIIYISSDSHQGASAIDYEEFGVYYDYGVRKSINMYSYYKLVLNTFATELARRLQSEGQVDVSVNVMCPGPVNSNIARDAPPVLKGFMKLIFSVFFRSPEKAARPVSYLTASSEMEGLTNDYLHMFNRKRMDEKVYLPEEGKKLWAASAAVWRRVDPRAGTYLLSAD